VRIATAARSRPAGRTSWWAPLRLSWWIALLFSVGSICFLVGPFPGFVELVGSRIDGIVFFVGSIFFTSAATLQYLETRRGSSLDRWSAAVQLVGTVFFNVSTFHALQAGLDTTEYNRLVWAPDALGSICFLVSGYLAYVAVCGRLFCRPRRVLVWWIAAINLLGCVAFGLSAIASYVIPSTGSALDLARANGFTALGALCFLIGAVLLVPAAADRAQRGSPDLGDVPRQSKDDGRVADKRRIIR
jgi:hypothetical protein